MSASVLAELASALGGEARGQAERPLCALRPLEEATAEDLAFVRGRRQLATASESAAGALLVPTELADDPALAGRDLLVVEDLDLALVRAVELLHPTSPVAPGVHPTAVLGDGCRIDRSAHVGPYVVLGEGCRVKAGAAVHAHAVAGRGCVIGAGAVLHPHVVLYDHTVVGAATVLHAGAVVGADGFGFVTRDGRHLRVPQVGRVELGHEVEVGANSTVDRGTLGATRIGAGTKIDNLVQVGHNVQIGGGCILCGQAGVAGSARLGDGVVLGGQAGVADHVELGDGVQVAAASAALTSVERGTVAGVPAIGIDQWRRQTVLLKHLPRLVRQLRSLVKRRGEEE